MDVAINLSARKERTSALFRKRFGIANRLLGPFTGTNWWRPFAASPKRQKIKLTGEAYQRLKLQVFTRDKWRCRRCGERLPLTVHHLIKRSDLRLDTLENCLSLCVGCHDAVERHDVVTLGMDANGLVMFRPNHDFET